MPKDRMIEVLGEGQLLLPGSLAGALGANDRVKYLLTLIQTARTDGAMGVTSLHDERLASGVDEVRLDRVVAQSTRDPDGRYRIPGVEMLARRAVDEVETMLAPLNVAMAPATLAACQARASVSRAIRRSAIAACTWTSS